MWVHKQNASATTSGTASSAVATFGSSVTLGSLLVGQISSFNGTGPAITFADTRANSWTQGLNVRPGAAAQVIAIWYALVTTGGSDAVTASVAAASFLSLSVDEYSFNGPMTVGSSNTATGTGAAPSSGSVTISGNCLLVGTATQSGSTGANPFGAGSGFNLRASSPLVGSVSIGFAAVDALNVTSSQAALFTLNASTAWQAAALAFAEAGAAGFMPWIFGDQIEANGIG